jgi:hypothetical protein
VDAKYFINRFLNIFETFKISDLLHFHSLLKPMLDFYECQRLQSVPFKTCLLYQPSCRTLPQFLRRHSISFQEIADVFFEISFKSIDF